MGNYPQPMTHCLLPVEALLQRFQRSTVYCAKHPEPVEGLTAYCSPICYIVFMIRITDQLSIPRDELKFTACRSSGPGGQHVNKASTRVTLGFDVINSPSLTPEQKQRVLDGLATRISKKGILRVISQKTRSQATNKEVALERFIGLLQQALKREPKRRPTRIPPAAKQRRVEEKKQRGKLKRVRSWKVTPDD
jgi:ribosome-associated protein